MNNLNAISNLILIGVVIFLSVNLMFRSNASSAKFKDQMHEIELESQEVVNRVDAINKGLQQKIETYNKIIGNQHKAILALEASMKKTQVLTKESKDKLDSLHIIEDGLWDRLEQLEELEP